MGNFEISEWSFRIFKFVENEPDAYYQYKKRKQESSKRNKFKYIEKQIDLEGELAEMDKKDRIFERRLKETQKYGKKQQKDNMEQRRKRKLQNQQELDQKEREREKKMQEKAKNKKRRPRTTEKNVFKNRPKTARDHLNLRRAVYDKYKLKNTKTYDKVFRMLIAGQSHVYRALEREKELQFQLDKSNLKPRVKNFSSACRSKPVTYFAEEDRQPVMIDQIIKDWKSKNTVRKKKVVKKRPIKVDKKQFDIKKKLRLKSNKPQKITKRVDNFVYLSNLLAQQKKLEKTPEKTEEEKVVRKYIKRPMTSRESRIKICTDMRIVSLASNSPERDNYTMRTASRGKATFYTDRKTPSAGGKRRNNLLSEHKLQSKSRNTLRQRPFTAKIGSASTNDYATFGTHKSMVKGMD